MVLENTRPGNSRIRIRSVFSWHFFLSPKLSKISTLLLHLGPGRPEVGPPVVQVDEEDRGGGEHDEARHAEVNQQHVAGDAEGEVPAHGHNVSTVPLSGHH